MRFAAPLSRETATEREDREELIRLPEEGKRRKEEVDGR